MKTEEKCTLLVNTCDAYSDVWDLFFAALHHQWKDCKFPIILNTESKRYPNGCGIEVINHKSLLKDCWGRRYKDTLKLIKTPYVIPVLEDFVLKEKFTGNKLLSETIKWMDENPDIGVFYLHKHPFVSQQNTEFKNFGLMPQKAEYKLTTGFGIWRKDYLNKCIKGFETPWEWELYSTRRAWRYKERIYALLESATSPYNFPLGGVIRRGLWHPEVVELAERYGVKINFETRGFMDENDPYRINSSYSVRECFPQEIGKLKFWIELLKRIKYVIRRVLCRI